MHTIVTEPCGKEATINTLVVEVVVPLDEVPVELPGGKLSIRWPGDGEQVLMTGPTAVVYEGSIKI